MRSECKAFGPSESASDSEPCRDVALFDECSRETFDTHDTAATDRDGDAHAVLVEVEPPVGRLRATGGVLDPARRQLDLVTEASPVADVGNRPRGGERAHGVIPSTPEAVMREHQRVLGAQTREIVASLHCAP